MLTDLHSRMYDSARFTKRPGAQLLLRDPIQGCRHLGVLHRYVSFGLVENLCDKRAQPGQQI